MSLFAKTFFTALLAMICASTVFFRFVEGWSWLDAYFFTIVTMSTVGYGDLVPQTPQGRIATTFLIIFGIGAFALGVQNLTRRVNHRLNIPSPEERLAQKLSKVGEEVEETLERARRRSDGS
ncbi:Voltage-gated potassium channel Kch [Pseudoruegeria aquimaris]|uniref:Voltage-gated potassium channel Kch n=1 Tax=Pseudoruegeria aquimaris TaxID=393663 RepID=A0A1Y5RIC7_9RHOB|nr:potassium channel family protein [Pseudoruegeria aquimaris]SLN18302.1 Voltage-gated potassium channel Kch [Pseudoruegeria aquimaris]